MSTFPRSILFSVIGLLGAAVLAGQSGGWLEIELNGPPPQILVYSESGAQWDFIDRTAPLAFNLKGRGRCFEDYHMRYAHICAGGSGDTSCIEPVVNQSNRSFSARDGTIWKVFTVNRQYLSPKLPAGSPVEVCNQGLQARVAQQGEAARAKILRDGFRVTVPEAYGAWFSLMCEKQTIFAFKDWSGVGDEVGVPAEIVCVGSADAGADMHRLKPQAHRLKPEAHRTAVEPGIKGAEIWINPKTAADYTGICPAKLHVGGELAYYLPEDDPVEVHYRYQVRQGRRSFTSPIFETRYEESGKRNLHAWTFEVAPATPTGIGGLAAPGAKPSPVLDGEIELVVLGNVPGAKSPSTSFHVTCTSVEAPVAGSAGMASGEEPSSPAPSARRMAAATRFGGWRVALPLRDTGRTGLPPGSYVVEVPTQTLAPGDEIAMVLYPTPGSIGGGTAPRTACKKVTKIDSFTVKQSIKSARSRVLADGGIEISVEAPVECGCTVKGVVEPAPSQ